LNQNTDNENENSNHYTNLLTRNNCAYKKSKQNHTFTKKEKAKKQNAEVGSNERLELKN
jgi:hypothetical protein